MKKIWLIIFIPIFIILVGTWSIQKKTSPPQLNILRIALPSNVQLLHCSSDANSLTFNRMLFEGLMRKDEKDIPQLAIAHTVDLSSDKKTYTFHLRDCQWSDGVEVTAYDFEYAWKNALNTTSKYLTLKPDLFYPIKNAQACLLGKTSIENVPIYAIDSKTLVVELEYPAPYFLELTSTPPLFPIPKHLAEKDPEWVTNPNLICNGPFILDKWAHNSEISLKKSPRYWDKQNVKLDGIDIFIISDSITAFNMFQKNELDWIGSPFFRISYDISYDVITQEAEEALIYWFSINTEKYPLTNEKLRKALSYALDRKSIVENVFHQSGKPTMSVLPNILKVRDEPYFQDNNAILAQNLFQDALEELKMSPNDFPEIELSYFAGFEFANRVCQAVQDQWRTVLGLKKIRLKSMEYQVYFDQVTKGNYEIGFMGWNTPVFDPLFIFNAFRDKSNPVNLSRWEKKEFKNLIDQSNLALEPTQRNNTLIQAEILLMDSMPIIPLCSLI